MEVIHVNQWNNDEVDNNEVEEIKLQRKSVIQHSSSSSSSNNNSDNYNIEVKGGGLDFIEVETKQKFEVVIKERNAEIMIPQENIIENDSILPASDPPLVEDSTNSFINVTNKSETIIIVKENGEERQEFYLENVFEKPPTHGFYCPNCNVCIQKVYIQKIYIQQEPNNIRCSSCFSFLIPIGSWLFPGLVSKVDEELNNQSSELGQSVTKIEDESGKQTLKIIENVVIDGSEAQKGGQVVTKKKPFWNDWGVIGDSSSSSSKVSKTVSTENTSWKVIAPISKKPDNNLEHKKQPDFVEVRVIESSTGSGEEVVDHVTEGTPLLGHSEPPIPSSNKALEILKSIVYGGLTESLASLSVVTSAASADAATLNIVALAIANLIGGLFALGNNLKELKTEQSKPSNTETEIVVDQYTEVLGERKNFILHTFIAIISFIIFGLIPPMVYGFTFQENDEKDFKLAAVAGASIFCITLLSVAKAYIKKPNSYITYFETVFYYVSTGGVATVLSYLAGDLVKKVLEKFGFFEPALSFGFKNQHGFGSY